MGALVGVSAVASMGKNIKRNGRCLNFTANIDTLVDGQAPTRAPTMPASRPGGNVRKSGPPAHQNNEKFIPSRADKHNTKQNLIDTLPDDGCCKKCADVLEWKKAYGKYKPLKTPAKCVGCHARVIMMAYHQLCEGCLRDKNACPKCLVVMEPEAPTLAELEPRKKPAKAREVDRPLGQVTLVPSSGVAPEASGATSEYAVAPRVPGDWRAK